jgi:glycosyltransferase involved in cell wall biosynthesis
MERNMQGTANGSCRHRLRVAHITLGLDVGGQERLLVEFARHADRSRFDLHFISLTTRGRLAGDIEACGWPVTALEEPAGLRPRMILRLAHLFRRHRFDVVHTHDDKPLLYASAAARLARVTHVLHTKHHGKVFPMRLRQTTVLNLAARLTDTFVCVSEDSARGTIQQGVASNKVRTIWNGIDTTRFAYSGPCPDGPAVTVARLSPEKDIGNLLQAIALLCRECPGFRLDIAGDGPCAQALRQMAADLVLSKCVKFLGEIRDIPALLGRASLFVLPSISEGISLTLLEAMARGLPVIATRVGGNPEVVAEGETGILVPARDAAAMAAAILQIHRDPEHGRRLGVAGRGRVERHFEIRGMVARYEALYREHWDLRLTAVRRTAVLRTAAKRQEVDIPG